MHDIVIGLFINRYEFDLAVHSQTTSLEHHPQTVSGITFLAGCYHVRETLITAEITT